MMKRPIVFAALSLAAVCASSAALARVNVGVFVNTPGPIYAAPPAIYAPPPPVVVVPQPGYGYGYRGDYHRGPRWHDHGRPHGWDRHHRRDW